LTGGATARNIPSSNLTDEDATKMTKGIDTSAMVAAALARGVQVTRVAAGERTVDEREFYAARHEDRLIRERHVVNEGTEREHCRNGLGEWIY
jgi:hypothetical protein